jgi:hypothetical protein
MRRKGRSEAGFMEGGIEEHEDSIHDLTGCAWSPDAHGTLNIRVEIKSMDPD